MTQPDLDDLVLKARVSWGIPIHPYTNAYGNHETIRNSGTHGSLPAPEDRQQGKAKEDPCVDHHPLSHLQPWRMGDG